LVASVVKSPMSLLLLSGLVISVNLMPHILNLQGEEC
jgi:hypothetical protein